jgi:hypothetical protein
VVYESIVEGGFNKQLKVEDGAEFDLANLEEHNAAGVATEVTRVDTPVQGQASAPNAPSRKRFSAFAFKKRNRTSGPAAPVVDAQTPAPVAAPVEGQQSKTETAEDDIGGVRVRIRIEALDENEKVLASPNAQTTYLHIVRMGTPPAPAEEGNEPEADTRQWMVKVVKREAMIGLHTFHLHEIYGLATGSNSSAPAPAPNHTYPPTSTGEDEEAHAQAYDFAGTECVLCLSEPREVVLLPCRHLVACKDCAINMIEFGAGGTLTHNEEGVAVPTNATTQTAATPGATGGDLDLEAGQAAPVVAPVTPRRKRKAKGWFCPVCRQRERHFCKMIFTELTYTGYSAYTSMLRITTTPPEAKKLTSDSESNLPAPASATPAINEPAVPPLAVVVDNNNANAGSSWKPSFLKGLGKNQGPTEEVAVGNTTTAAEGTSTVETDPAPALATTSADHLGASQPIEPATH